MGWILIVAAKVAACLQRHEVPPNIHFQDTFASCACPLRVKKMKVTVESALQTTSPFPAVDLVSTSENIGLAPS